MDSDRTYRNRIRRNDLVSFRVVSKETDLLVQAERDLTELTTDLVLQHRRVIESYIERYPEVGKILTPWNDRGPTPLIISEMTAAGETAGVGPMAAVAGAIAQQVGIELLLHSEEVIVENGGDIFLKIEKPGVVAIYAGNSPLNMKVGLKVYPGDCPLSICTSSGTVGHSLSLGKADAVCVVSANCALADAVATAIGNRVKTVKDIQKAISFGKQIAGIKGLVVIISNQIGLWGELEVVPLA